MANGFELKALITGVDRLSPELNRMSKKLKGFKKEAATIAATAAGIGVAIGTAFIVPVQQAIQFETSMADVRKVVDFESPEQFRQMSEDILRLSTELPIAADGIAEIVAAGGQSGIAREDLKAFAQDAVKMGVAFDQTAGEAGEMMAQWRTAFKLTQPEVVALADKINYLSNNSPASAQKISQIVTEIGSLGEVAGLRSGDLAAMGATIAGMGVKSDVAATGIKNFMLALTSGNAKGDKKLAFNALKLNPKKVAAGMKKDARATMLLVLQQIQKIKPEKQAALLETVFGRESLGAIAPLLTNLDLLRVNLDRVTDAGLYGGSMQKEYAARAATTANEIQLFKNQIEVTGITIGEIFLPPINAGMKVLQPFIEQFRTFVKQNPETVQSLARTAAGLVMFGAAVKGIGSVINIVSGIWKMSPLGRMVAVLALGATLIIQHWGTLGPIIKKVAGYVDEVAQAFGGWQVVLTGLMVFMGGKWLTGMLTPIRKVAAESALMSKNLGKGGMVGKAGLYGLTAAMMYEPVSSTMQSVVGNKAAGWMQNHGLFLSSDYRPFFDRQSYEAHEKALTRPTMDRPAGSVTQSELKVTFDGAPPGMKVEPVGSQPTNIDYSVGYNRFAVPN